MRDVERDVAEVGVVGEGGPERVRYAGRVTHFDEQLGLRVWFDGSSASEQEWVNEADEWEWAGPPASASAPSQSAAFVAVRLRMRAGCGGARARARAR